MATGGSQGTDVVKGVGAVIALLAGSVALLYVAGGGALTLRLFLNDLPSLNVVAQLPRETLISVALTQIVLPVVAAGSVYALFRLLLGGTAPPPRTLIGEWHERSWRSWSARFAAGAALALVTTLLGASPAFARGPHSSTVLWVLTIVFVLNVVVMMVALRLRAEVAARAEGRWNTLSSGGSMTLIVALAAVPTCFLFAGTFWLLNAKVCTRNQPARVGLLIGETSDRIYLGEMSEHRWHQSDTAEDPLRVVSIPRSEIEELSIASEPDPSPC